MDRDKLYKITLYSLFISFVGILLLAFPSFIDGLNESPIALVDRLEKNKLYNLTLVIIGNIFRFSFVLWIILSVLKLYNKHFVKK